LLLRLAILPVQRPPVIASVQSDIILNMEAVKGFLRSRYDWKYHKDQFIFLEDEHINQFYKHTPAGWLELLVCRN
jgi:hypothetical protein